LREELIEAISQFSGPSGWYKSLESDIERERDEDELERMKEIAIKRLQSELKVLQGALSKLME